MKKLFQEQEYIENSDGTKTIHYLETAKNEDNNTMLLQISKEKSDNMLYVPQPTKYILNKILNETEAEIDCSAYKSVDEWNTDHRLDILKVSIQRAMNNIAKKARRGAGNVVYCNLNADTTRLVTQSFKEYDRVIFVNSKHVPKDKIVIGYVGETGTDAAFIWADEQDLFVNPMWKDYHSVIQLNYSVGS